MADIPSAAQALYPNLKSDVPAPETAPAADASERSAAEKIYGTTPRDGGEVARETIDSGKARPSAEVEASEAADAQGEAGATAPSHLVAEFNTLAREAGLSSDRSAALMKLHQDALVETSTKYWADQGAAWEKQSRAQFGSRLDGMVGAVKPLLNDPGLTPPAFLNLLNQYRIGSHPVVIDTLSRWAQEMRRGR